MAQGIEDVALRLRLVENAKCLRGQEPTWDQIATRFAEALESVVSNAKQTRA